MAHYAYSNNGDSWRCVQPDWELGEGETLFDHVPTEAELEALFPGRRQVLMESLRAASVAAVQTELDRQAQAKGYDNIVSACSYAAQPAGAPFQAEGAAFLKWRSAVWQQAYAMLAEVEVGARALPTPEESVAAMPALVLP